MSQSIEENTASVQPAKSRLLLAITILLALLLLLNIAQFALTLQQDKLAAARASTHQERAGAAQALVENQAEVISSLMTDYQAAAYNNPSVDRITEQQLLATESTLAALQVIAIQNSQIIQLLATAP